METRDITRVARLEQQIANLESKLAEEQDKYRTLNLEIDDHLKANQIGQAKAKLLFKKKAARQVELLSKLVASSHEKLRAEQAKPAAKKFVAKKGRKMSPEMKSKREILEAALKKQEKEKLKRVLEASLFGRLQRGKKFEPVAPLPYSMLEFSSLV